MQLVASLCLLVACATWVVAFPQITPSADEEDAPRGPLSAHLQGIAPPPAPVEQIIGQRDGCSCVPIGDCNGPSPPEPIPTAPTPPIPAPSTSECDPNNIRGCVNLYIVNLGDQGIPNPPSQQIPIDGIRVVNIPNVASRTCPPEQELCCPPQNLKLKPPPPAVRSCGVGTPIDTPEYTLDATQTKFGEFPWMAIILDPNDKYVGGAVLISDRHVLTAAHKIERFGPESGLQVRLGDWDIKADVEPFKNIKIPVKSVKVHPSYNQNILHNDLALLTLDSPVNIGEHPHINSACLPDRSVNFIGQRCWITGWGKDAFGETGAFQFILKKVDVPVLDTNECEQRLRLTKLGQTYNLSRTSFVCAGGEKGKGTCNGDGGSPLVCEVNGRSELVGLAAWGIGCADGIPDVYVNALTYVDWINSELI